MGHSWMYRLVPFILALAATSAGAADYFQQDVRYTMHARLDHDNRMLTGDQTILYANNSPDTLRNFYLHLYPNAYRNRHTEFMTFFRRRFNINIIDVPTSHRGWLDIRNVRVNGKIVDVQVDDTIAHIELSVPLEPGASMTVELDFASKVRKQLGRAGYRGNHYDFAQWYPKVVVYDEKGFHPDKFVTGEFYGEFGTFDVQLTVPGDFVIAATGMLAEGDAGWGFNPPGSKAASQPENGPRVVRFHAENVHDFAWCADPDFIVEHTEVNGIDIRSFYRRSNADTWADSTLAHGVRAIEWLTREYGPYPYPQVSIVDALLSGGMEYPMLVMDGRANEGLVVHEVGHIYFYGILANDERADAWMDEGFTTFQTRRFMEERYGPWGNKQKWNWYQRMTPQPTLWKDYRDQVFWYQRRAYGERVAQRAEAFDHSYSVQVYRHAALFLNATRYALGDDAFGRAMQSYYDEWKLKHVNEERFQRSVQAVTSQNIERQFEQWLHSVKIVDYKLAGVKTEEANGRAMTTVTIEREGELYLPLEVHFDMPDGSVEKRRIDGRLRTITETFELPGTPKRVSVNPNNEIMDVDLADNFSPRDYKWQIDWPNNHEYPEGGYGFRHRPAAWYNIEDGLKFGWHLRGSYYNWSRRLSLGMYYGVESERLDFSVSYDKPMIFMGQRGRLKVSGYKMEGRQDAALEMRLFRQPRLAVPPAHEFVFAYDYHKLSNDRYLNSTEIYDTNRVDIGLTIGYRTQPQADVFSSSITTDLRLGRGWTGGKYQYERFTLDLSLKTRADYVPVDLRLRGFLGLIGGEIPTQQKFSIAGAGPLEQEKRFWLRSPDAVPDDLNYHAPGDGNIRGYALGTFGVNRLVAFNAEAGTRLPLWLLSPVLKPIVGDLSWYGFYDAGQILDAANPIGSSARVAALVDAGILDATLQDAGIGFRAHPNWPFWNLQLRLDLPLWVNHPEVNGETDKSRLRYLFSLMKTF